MDELNCQLVQLKAALVVASDEEKSNLQEVIREINALIEIETNGGEKEEIHGPEPELRNEPIDGVEDDEFIRFQKEIKCLEQVCNETPSISVGCSSDNKEVGAEIDSTHISELFSDLVGMKCRAPFEHQWGRFGYHNGIVFSVETMSDIPSLEDVTVRIVFAQPITETMRPCQFFLEGRCRFTQDECKFSHGELVQLSKLKEFREPNYSIITAGTRVLAKYIDDLWKYATVSRMTSSGNFDIIFDSYSEVVTTPIDKIIPFNSDDEQLDESSSTSDSSDDDDLLNQQELASLPHCSEEVWSHMNGTARLGQWEKHTKGIGSKLMQKMGYVIGTGLGKAGAGMIDPIDAVVLPPGRSLDKCMELREKAGSSVANLFSVEKHLKRIQRKEQLNAEKLQKKATNSGSVFCFLNSQLNLKKEVNKPKISSQLTKQSAANLNCTLLNLGERIKQVAKDISKCKEAVKRHDGKDQATVIQMKHKLKSLEAKLVDLKQSELNVTSEQNNRTNKNKLMIF